MTGHGNEETFWGAENVLYLDLEVGYMSVNECVNSSTLPLINVFYALYTYYTSKYVFLKTPELVFFLEEILNLQRGKNFAMLKFSEVSYFLHK